MSLVPKFAYLLFLNIENEKERRRKIHFRSKKKKKKDKWFGSDVFDFIATLYGASCLPISKKLPLGQRGLQISDDLYPFINLERQTYEIGIVMPAGGSDATTKIKTTF